MSERYDYDHAHEQHERDEMECSMKDYEVLLKQNEKMKEVLRWIGYPKRGSDSDDWDIQDAANHIRINFTRDELGLDA